MENIFLLLREHRRLTRDLSHFLEAMSLYLQAGYDLSYAWPMAVKILGSGISTKMQTLLSLEPQALETPTSSETYDAPTGLIGARLQKLGKFYPVFGHRLWFLVLRELYIDGAGLRQPVLSMAHTLRNELKRELEEHCRKLPSKVNILMVIFFLPATLFLFLAPFVMELIKSFP